MRILFTTAIGHALFLNLIVVDVRVSMAQEDQAMPVHQPGVRVHQPDGIFWFLRLPAAHPGIIRRGQGRRRKPKLF